MCCKKNHFEERLSNLSCINSNRKVILVGEAGVGKSSLLVRYIKNIFEESHNTTIGGSFVQIEVEVDDKMVTLDVWDTAGQEKYRSLMTLYFRHASVAIITYDVSNKDSFEKSENWVSTVLEKEPKAILFLVGTKSDIHTEVTQAEISNYCKRYHMTSIETSAKSGENVALLFKLIATAITKN